VGKSVPAYVRALRLLHLQGRIVVGDALLDRPTEQGTSSGDEMFLRVQAVLVVDPSGAGLPVASELGDQANVAGPDLIEVVLAKMLGQ
jgi:hypothetical protein